MRLRYEFETMELDDIVVAVPVGVGAAEFRGVIKLNETASFMLSLLKNDISKDQIIDALSKEYGVPYNVVVDDVDKYLNEFRERDLIV